jgi:hypothetical protein
MKDVRSATQLRFFSRHFCLHGSCKLEIIRVPNNIKNHDGVKLRRGIKICPIIHPHAICISIYFVTYLEINLISAAALSVFED